MDNSYRLCLLKDLNGWVGDRMRVDMTCAFGDLGENDNGRRVIDLCVDRVLCMGNVYFMHKSLANYTRVARDQDEVNVMSMTDMMP